MTPFLPSRLCLQAGVLEWIIEVLIWTSSVFEFWGPLPVIDFIWGWFISRLSTAINVQRPDLSLLTSKTQAGVFQVWSKVTFGATLWTHQSVEGSVNSLLIRIPYECVCVSFSSVVHRILFTCPYCGVWLGQESALWGSKIVLNLSEKPVLCAYSLRWKWKFSV